MTGEPITTNEGIHICANCGETQKEEYMAYSSIFRGWLCSACKSKDGDADVPIRVSLEAHKWLLKNRGSGPVKKLVDKVITKYHYDIKKEGDLHESRP
jgi:hypothetical protein